MLKLLPKTGFFNTSNKLPIVYWSGFSDDNLSEIQIKINDGEYKTLGTRLKMEKVSFRALIFQRMENTH